MKNNNGKIAIAIVAMFVVALSIVGVTYAYFTATVTENADTAKEVIVTAGSMEVEYTGGKTFTASNLLPGWSNNSDKYYDAVHSAKYDSASGETRYSAVSKSELTSKGETVTYYGGSEATAGMAAPVTFSVTNTGDNDAAYTVKMEVVSNSINTTGDLTYIAYAANTETALSSNDPATLASYKIKEGTIGAATATAETYLEIDPNVKLGTTTNTAKYYKIIFTYADNGDQSTTDNNQQNKSFQTKMHVIGLDQTKAGY